MDLIGYTCPNIPVELLSATGLIPYCLLHGDIGLAQSGEKYVRIDACPLVKSNLAYIISNRNKFGAIVGSTGCDMGRRMFDVINENTTIPTYLLNMPRTDKPEIFSDELDWLVKELEHFSNKEVSDDVIGREIEMWEEIRKQYRPFDKMRAGSESLVTTSDFHTVAMDYYKGNKNAVINIPEKKSDKPRVYLIGSELSYEAHTLLELLERELSVVGDFICGISSFLNIKIEARNLAGIKDAYYNQPPCVYKRPNQKYYDYVTQQLEERNCTGIVAWTLDYCDSYEFELKRMEKKFGLPLLRIRSDLSFQNISQLKTRIEAFKEILC